MIIGAVLVADETFAFPFCQWDCPKYQICQIICCLAVEYFLRWPLLRTEFVCFTSWWPFFLSCHHYWLARGTGTCNGFFLEKREL